MAEKVSKEEVMHIAKLACLNLSEDELSRYTKDMQEMLEFADTINNLDTENVNETLGSISKSNAFRKDQVVDFPNKDLLLKNAPSQEDGMFHIPKVIN